MGGSWQFSFLGLRGRVMDQRAGWRSQDRSRNWSRRSMRIGHSVLPMLFSTACTGATTKTPVLWTSGSGMLSAHASIRVARLSSHGIVPAAGDTVLDREGVRMVISCDGEDDGGGYAIRLRRR